MLLVSAFFIYDFLSYNSGGLLTQYFHVTATLVFLQTQDQYKKQIEDTDQAKWFEKSFPNYETEYDITYGFRHIKYKYVQDSSKIVFLQFTEGPDRVLQTIYWCVYDQRRSALTNPSVEELEKGNCFLE